MYAVLRIISSWVRQRKPGCFLSCRLNLVHPGLSGSLAFSLGLHRWVPRSVRRAASVDHLCDVHWFPRIDWDTAPSYNSPSLSVFKSTRFCWAMVAHSLNPGLVGQRNMELYTFEAILVYREFRDRQGYTIILSWNTKNRQIILNSTLTPCSDFALWICLLKRKSWRA